LIEGWLMPERGKLSQTRRWSGEFAHGKN